MPRPQGEPAGSMKWHRLRYPEKPKTFVGLGVILKDPYEVEESLIQEDGVIPVPGECVKDVSEAVTTAVTTHLFTETESHLTGLFPLHVGANIGGSISRSSQQATERVVQASGIQASFFRPSEDYMNKVMMHPAVTKYLGGSWLRGGKIYIIVGVAKATSLSVDDKTHNALQAGVTAAAQAPLLAGEIDAGITHARDGATEISYSTNHEVVFAYRVREFKFSRIRKQLKDRGNVINGALLGTEAGHGIDDVVPVTSDYYFEFDGFPDDDDDYDEDSSIDGSETLNATADIDGAELDFWVQA